MQQVLCFFGEFSDGSDVSLMDHVTRLGETLLLVVNFKLLDQLLGVKKLRGIFVRHLLEWHEDFLNFLGLFHHLVLLQF